MATQTNVEFYEKLKEMQEVQHDSERKRMELNQQLNSYMKSDHRLARLKAVRLQNYWKKICEDEKKSRWRNEQLLRDLDRVESHLGTLSSRTDRLRTMKKQYEDYIEKTYPNWKEKILHNQRLQQQQQRQQQLQASLQQQTLAPQQHSVSPNSQPYSLAPNPQSVSMAPAPQAYSMAPAPQPVSMIPSQNHSITTATALPQQPSTVNPPGYINLEEQRDAYRISTTLPPPQTAAALAKLDESYGFGTAPQVQGQSFLPNYSEIQPQNQHFQQREDEGIASRQNQAVSRQQSVENAQHREKQNPASLVAKVMTQQSDSQGLVVVPTMQQENTGADHVVEEPIAAVMSPRRPSGYGEWKDPTSNSGKQPQTEPTEDLDDTSEEFDSDMSLPMNDTDKSPVSKPAVVTAAASEQRASPERVMSPESVYLRPDITVDGLYNLFAAIEEELPITSQKKSLYRDSAPTESVKREICQNANTSQLLTHLNLVSVSMVALDQLPLLVLGCENGGLLPDNILYRPSAVADQHSVRASIHPTSQAFWDRLCHHFLHLLKYESMDSNDIGEMFGPLLIAEDSPYSEKSEVLVATVMGNADPGIIESPASTTTFSTLSPRKRTDEPDARLQPENVKRPPVINEVPEDIAQKPKDSSSDDDGDDFFDQPVPKPAPEPNTTPLTQTAAYRQLLGDTLSTSHKSVSYADSDSDDDIENMLGTVQKDSVTKPTSPAPPTTPGGVAGDRPFSPPGGGSRVSSPSVTSAPGGYVPSGLDTPGPKSGTGSMASLGKKKGPAFSFGGDSDTDEDVDIPGMNSGGKKEVVDEFDFYD